MNELNFGQALDAIISGGKVTRTEWENPKVYAFMVNNILNIHRDGKVHQWVIHLNDILAEDWIVVA
jgi:hypothetical protein